MTVKKFSAASDLTVLGHPVSLNRVTSTPAIDSYSTLGEGLLLLSREKDLTDSF